MMLGHVAGHSFNWKLDGGHQLIGVRYKCGYCGTDTAPRMSIGADWLVNKMNTGNKVWLHICPVCTRPTFVDESQAQVPAVRMGADLFSVPDDGLRQLYDEARDCTAAGAYTACVMACRKILMNLAVREGAKPGQNFTEYVDYLESNGFVPRKGKAWVDRIRKMGNEANHDIAAKSADDATDILHLVEMLLRFNFDLGAPSSSSAP